VKIGIIADLHLRGSDLQERRELLKSVCHDMFVEHDVSLLLNLGDTFDSGHVGDSKESWEKVFLSYDIPRELQTDHIILEGNHDYWDPTGESALDVLSKDYLVVSRGISSYRFHNVLICCLPWFDKLRWGKNAKSKSEIQNEFKKEVESFRKFWGKSSFCLLAAHIEVRGSLGDNGRVLVTDSLNEWTEDELDYMGFDKIFCGHYHKPQTLGKKTPIKYVGTILQKDFGERDNETGYYVVSAAEDKYVPTRGTWFKKVMWPDIESNSCNRVLDNARVRVYGADTPQQIKDAEKVFRGKCAHLKFVQKSSVVSDRDSSVEIVREMSFQDKLDAWISDSGLTLDKDVSKPYLEHFDDITVDLDQVGYLDQVHSAKFENVYVHKNLEVDYGSGAFCIVGPNGSGKTFILEALFAGVYGKWASRRDSQKSTVKSCLTVDFSAKGDRWKVVRRSSSSESLTTVHRKVGEAFEQVAGGPSKGTQANEFLKALVGSEDIMRGCCYIENNKSDLIEETSGNRMKWMRDWLGFGVYEDFHKYLKDQAVGFKSLESDLEKSRRLLDVATNEAAYEREETEKSKKEFDRLSAELKNLAEEREFFEEKVKKMREFLMYEKSVESSKTQLETNTHKLRDLLKITKQLSEEVDSELRDFSEEESLRAKWILIKSAIEKAEDQAKELSKAGCAANPIECFFISRGLKAKREAESLKKELIDLGWSPEREELFSQKKLHIEDLQRNLKKAETQVTSTYALINHLQGVLDSASGQAPPKPVDLGNYDTYSRKIQELNSKVNLIALQVDECRVKTRVHDNYREKAEKAIVDLTEQVLSLEKDFEKKKALEVLIEATSREGLVQSLIHNEIPKIQKHIDELLDLIDAEFRITLKTQKPTKRGDLSETFDIIFSRRGVSYDVRSGSAGERALVRVVLRLAILLTRSDSRYRVLFLDEPTAASDVSFRDDTIKLLSVCKKWFSQIIMVTHDHTVSTFSNNVLRLDGSDG